MKVRMVKMTATRRMMMVTMVLLIVRMAMMW